MKKIISLFAGLLLATTISAKGNSLKAGEVINKIIKQTGCEIIPNTVDTIKEGDVSAEVTGIICCMFATMDVLETAVEKNCNLIIVHEPLYYNHEDKTDNLKDNSVYLEKHRFIKENNLVIWRFHDYIHFMQPDGIMEGMITKLDWKKYQIKKYPGLFELPELSLESLLVSLKQKFNGNTFQYVGKLNQPVKKIFLLPGAPGGESHIAALAHKEIDVIITGEAPQWETYEYTRDAVDQNRNKAVIFLGHLISEEAGMLHCSHWLKSFITNIPVHYMENKVSYKLY